MKSNLIYFLPCLFLFLHFGCQSNKEGDQPKHDDSTEKTTNKPVKSKKIEIDAPTDVLDQIKDQENQRNTKVLSLEEQLRASCIPSSVSDSIHVLLVIDPDGTLSFSDVYKAPSDKIKECILHYVKTKKIDFGQVISAGSGRNKSGKTMHEIVLTGAK